MRLVERGADQVVHAGIHDDEPAYTALQPPICGLFADAAFLLQAAGYPF
jgi:hypothetical protein